MRKLFFLSISLAIAVIYLSATTKLLAQEFVSVTQLTPISIGQNTGEKPQSKVWAHAGTHWTIMPDIRGTHLWRLDGTTWKNVFTISTTKGTKADCKVVGDIVHVFLFRKSPSVSELVSIEYVASMNTYKRWSVRSTTTSVTLDPGVESATIDIDGTGKMWLASDATNEIYVRSSDYPYNSWSSRTQVASGITDDDLCSIISLPGKMGVFWSNQNTKRFGFRTHQDGAVNSEWSSDEVPASQSALNVGIGMADDHVNLAVSADGTLYCAVKTGYDTRGYPRIALLVRRPNGSWDNLYNVSEIGTRPIVILNESAGSLKVVYCSKEKGGDLLYSASALSNISFSSPKILIQGSFVSPTSIKDNYSSEVVILASTEVEDKAVSVLAKDGTSTPPPTVPQAPLLASPLNNAIGVSTAPILTWNHASGAATYQAQVSTVSNFSSTVYNQSGIQATSVSISGLNKETLYYWRVRAANSAGSGNWSATWSFTTEKESTPPPSGNALVGHWPMEEGGGTRLQDASGHANHATTIKDPTWNSGGPSGLALYLDGSKQYASVSNAASLNITNAITLMGWVKPERTATQYIVSKAVTGVVDGYEFALATGGEIFFRLNHYTSGNTYRLSSTVPYPTNGSTWVHLAATYDGSVMRLYINGTLNASSSPNLQTQIRTNDLPLTIGARSDGSNKYQGAIDDVRVYNTALNSTEIASIMRAVSTMTASTAQSLHLEQSNLSTEIHAYPNPMTSRATLNFALSHAGEYTVSLYNMRGERIRELRNGRGMPHTLNSVEFDAANLPRGLYIVRLQTKSESKALKILVE